MAVSFIRSTTEQAEKALFKALSEALKMHKRVLWIVTGGSGIPLVTRVMEKVPEEDSVKLAILLTDERFGPVGHPDSNLQQLYNAGFNPKRATVIPVLRPGASLEDTTKLYDEVTRTAFEAADYSLGVFGMGVDGHIAGILPRSPATKLTKSWSFSYEAGEYTRITLTPFAISHLSEAMIIALGEPKKRPALENLKKQLSVTRQPAQLLKKLPIFTVLNDQIGDAA